MSPSPFPTTITITPRAPYMFIISLDYVLRTSIDLMKENGFKLTKERTRRYVAPTITDADYADDRAILTNTPAQAKTLLHSRERLAGGIYLHIIADKTEYICFNQTGFIFTLNGSYRKLVDLPRKQCLINLDRHQHSTSKGMSSYQ